MSGETPAAEPAPTADEPEDARPRVIGQIVSGLSWNTASQAVAVLISLGLTPFLLVRLGTDAYGVFALVSSTRGLLSNLDGGLGPACYRYFPVYAGAGDRRGTSRFLATMCILTVAVVGLVAALAALFAPDITGVLHTSVALKRQGATVMRYFMPLLVVAAIRVLFQRILTAEHRWAYVNVAQAASTIVYAALAVVLVAGGRGLMGVLWASVGQEVVLLVTSVIAARRHISARDLRFMGRDDLRDLVRFASRVQVAELASSFNYELDAILVGLIFPVRYVAYYGIGANFSSQLVLLPVNAISPIAVVVARVYGRSGLKGALAEFVTMQRMWVRTLSAFPIVGAIAAYFGIARWLGADERLAGAVAAILLLGQTLPVLAGVMDVTAKAINMPGLESRYLGAGVVINVALTVPLAFTIGMLGVPIGTAFGLLVSRFYFLRIARRDIEKDLRSFLADVPTLAVAVAAAVTLALEIALYRVAPRGVVGLLTCAVPAGIGLGVYAIILCGPRQVAAFVAAGLGRSGTRTR